MTVLSTNEDKPQDTPTETPKRPENPYIPGRNWPKKDETLDDPTSVPGNENIIEQ